MKYLKGTTTQGIITKTDPEKGIECYVDANFYGRQNKEEVTELRLVLPRTGYTLTYDNCPIIWESRPQIQIELSNTEAEYITLYKSTRGVLPFVILMKDI